MSITLVGPFVDLNALGVRTLSQLATLDQGGELVRNSPRGDSAVLSAAGQFLQKIQELQDSDPEKVQSVLTQAADQLQAALQQSSAIPRTDALAGVASALAQVIASITQSDQTDRVSGPTVVGSSQKRERQSSEPAADE